MKVSVLGEKSVSEKLSVALQLTKINESVDCQGEETLKIRGTCPPPQPSSHVYVFDSNLCPNCYKGRQANQIQSTLSQSQKNF